MPCRFCATVNTICFWGPRPVRSWKRPVLLIGSVPILVGGFAFAWVMFQQQSIAAALLGLTLLAMGAFGIVTSLLGCDDCVARLFGDLI
jgi:uncharacterized membrane protein HdeD (DUF308 family)